MGLRNRIENFVSRRIDNPVDNDYKEKETAVVFIIKESSDVYLYARDYEIQS